MKRKRDNAGDSAEEEMEGSLGEVLSKKDKLVDSFLLRMAEKLCRDFEDAEGGPVTFVAEEKTQQLLDLTDEKMSDLSITLGHKFGAILKKYIVLCQERKASCALSRISVPSLNLKTMAENYRHCFTRFVDSPFVSYMATSVKELGQLTTKDAFVLHLWSMLNCYRSKGDQMMAICISGLTSVGKSSLFESPAYENGHSYVAEAGVGRFAVKKRSTLIYSDISVDVLYKSKDAPKFRTIARAEPTTVKIFGDTCTLPPLWILITSNQRVHTHVLPTDRKGALSDNVYRSHLVVPPNKKHLFKDTLGAVKNRVIECYCTQRPEIDSEHLPTHGSFTRTHFLLGAFSYVLGVLEKYQTSSFYSPAILNYALTALVDNIELYERVMDDGTRQRGRLVNLIRALVPLGEQRNTYLARFLVTDSEEEEEEEGGSSSEWETEEVATQMQSGEWETEEVLIELEGKNKIQGEAEKGEEAEDSFWTRVFEQDGQEFI